MIRDFFYNIFINNLGLSDSSAKFINLSISIIIFAILGFVLFKLFRFIGKRTVYKIVEQTETRFDNILFKNHVFLNLSRVVIFFIVYGFIGEILADFPQFLDYGTRIIDIAIIFSIIVLLGSIFSSIKDFMLTNPAYKDKPLKSYVQIFMMVTWIIGVVIASSILIGKPLEEILFKLGAFSAILLLIFKDVILGFVASIQVAINDTVRIGDWITMDKYGANGDVIEINLTSVIIKNFDNTISSIPTYHLVSDSFKNWRTMNTSGGRRIMRSVLIKMNSVKFLSNDDIERFKQIQLITDYIDSMNETVNIFNEKHNIDKSVLINGRNLTNFGTFRVYLDKYLEKHPYINHNMTFMSRQLAPTPHGIPLEIYAFSRKKEWIEYERVMANIFDHILASVKYFDLEVFENPSSADIRKISKYIKK